VLLVTLDQFRGDCLSANGHRVVRTPHLDALAADGVRFTRHYGQAAPCAPGRAALYTGTYQMTNRVVANGTPLDDRFDNVARVARRAGYRPMLFGYTDQGIDPRTVDANDPRLSTYEGVLPGFDVPAIVDGDPVPHEAWMRSWRTWLADQGYDVGDDWMATLSTEPDRADHLSASRFLTDHVTAWWDELSDDELSDAEPWFAHVSYLRPHPPRAAAGQYASMYDPDALDLPISPVEASRRTALHELAMTLPGVGAPTDPAEMRRVLAQYYGMISEVDAQIGLLRSALEARDMWDDTVVVVTADHGEQAGDHGLLEKLGFFEQSFHIPCIVRDPRRSAARGRAVGHFTEAVDILPTICDLIGADIPHQCAGASLAPFLDGDDPTFWRTAAHWEYDWRDAFLAGFPAPRSDPRLEHQNVATLRTETHAYVQFGDGTWRCFDLAADPTWRTTTDDPAIVLPLAQQMLAWRAEHLDRTMTGMLLRDGGIGHIPRSW
jgi:arylsulfatase A-like enzyme